jgi:hypothetical protein
MDEGSAVAYEVLDPGVPVMASGGEVVGTVDHVVAARHEDIFHGIVIDCASGPRFVAADEVASLHEHGVDLRIAAAEVAQLPTPHGAAPSYHDAEPGVKPTRWEHLLDRFARPGGEFKRDWSQTD